MKEAAEWRDPALGDARDVETSQGRIRAHDIGTGPTLVFVHGALVNANLWRKVVAPLAKEFRCVTLDLPLGSHTLPMPPDADLSPPALARMITEAIEAMGAKGATLVGNDTGGALSQLVATRHPDSIGALVLTSCDAFDNFPPRLFKVALAPLAIPRLGRLLFAPVRFDPVRRLPFAFGWLVHRPIEKRASDTYVLPGLESKAVGRDTAKLLAGIDPRYTLEAAERFGELDLPVLIAWSRDDRFFPPEHAERLAAAIPGARLQWIEEARTFSPEDRPDRLAEVVGEFVRDRVAAAATA